MKYLALLFLVSCATYEPQVPQMYEFKLRIIYADKAQIVRICGKSAGGCANWNVEEKTCRIIVPHATRYTNREARIWGKEIMHCGYGYYHE